MELARKFVGYFAVGTIAAAIDLGLFWLLDRIGVAILPAAAASVSVAVCANFLMLSLLVYRLELFHLKRFALFVSWSALGLAANAALSYWFIGLGMHILLGKALAILAVFLVNFTFNTAVTFAKLDTRRGPEEG